MSTSLSAKRPRSTEKSSIEKLSEEKIRGRKEGKEENVKRKGKNVKRAKVVEEKGTKKKYETFDWRTHLLVLSTTSYITTAVGIDVYNSAKLFCPGQLDVKFTSDISSVTGGAILDHLYKAGEIAQIGGMLSSAISKEWDNAKFAALDVLRKNATLEKMVSQICTYLISKRAKLQELAKIKHRKELEKISTLREIKSLECLLTFTEKELENIKKAAPLQQCYYLLYVECFLRWTGHLYLLPQHNLLVDQLDLRTYYQELFPPLPTKTELCDFPSGVDKLIVDYCQVNWCGETKTSEFTEDVEEMFERLLKLV